MVLRMEVAMKGPKKNDDGGLIPYDGDGGEPAEATAVPVVLVDDVRSLIESARERVASAVNSEIVLLCWRIGQRIKRELIGEGRAAYGG